jgi:hypothetical protein
LTIPIEAKVVTKTLLMNRSRQRYQRPSGATLLMILFSIAGSAWLPLGSLNATENEPAIPRRLLISSGDFFTSNYYLEIHENGDLIYRQTEGDQGRPISEVTVRPPAAKWRDFRLSNLMSGTGDLSI